MELTHIFEYYLFRLFVLIIFLANCKECSAQDQPVCTVKATKYSGCW